MNDFELIRKRYKPNTTNLLFIAESPPNGGTFFYCENSNLYRAVKSGFLNVISSTLSDNFLDFFKSQGCYLDDLCLAPINGMNNVERLNERKKGIIPLSNRIKQNNPHGIIILMKGIESEVKAAIKLANLTNLQFVITTSFPANSDKNRKKCIHDIASMVKDCISKNIINLIIS